MQAIETALREFFDANHSCLGDGGDDCAPAKAIGPKSTAKLSCADAAIVLDVARNIDAMHNKTIRRLRSRLAVRSEVEALARRAFASPPPTNAVDVDDDVDDVDASERSARAANQGKRAARLAAAEARLLLLLLLHARASAAVAETLDGRIRMVELVERLELLAEFVRSQPHGRSLKVDLLARAS